MNDIPRVFRISFLGRFLLVLVIAVLPFSLGPKAFAGPQTEHYKITYLLNIIGSSNLVFIRNGVEYSGQEAKDHLQKKMDNAGNNIHTAEDFINYIASESSITGVPYYVKFADGRQVEAGIWLRDKLAQMK